MLKIDRSQILLKDLKIFAYHGVLPQERVVGAYYILNITLDTDFSQAMETDELDATVSYADVFEVVKAEMAVPSRLLEHVAGRITNALFARFPAVTAIHLEIIKENPPMGADCRGAGVSVTLHR